MLSQYVFNLRGNTQQNSCLISCVASRNCGEIMHIVGIVVFVSNSDLAMGDGL